MAKLKNDILPDAKSKNINIRTVCCSYDTDVFEVRNPLIVNWDSIRKSVKIIILSGCLARLANTVSTNDKAFLVESPWKTVPRPTASSVSKYVDYLKNNRQDINDYVMGLFEKYDHVVLCERHHQDMTQYDMIYDLLTDSRFVDNVGVVFTEIETDGWCAGSLGRRIHIPLYPD